MATQPVQLTECYEPKIALLVAGSLWTEPQFESTSASKSDTGSILRIKMRLHLAGLSATLSAELNNFIHIYELSNRGVYSMVKSAVGQTALLPAESEAWCRAQEFCPRFEI